MAQSKQNDSTSNSISRLSLKRAKELILRYDGILDTSFSNEYFNNAYKLSDGRAILLFETHGFLYNSLDDIKRHIALLKQKQSNNEPSHILENRLLYGAEFIDHIPELISRITKTFHLKTEAVTIDHLKSIDAYFNSEKHKIKINEDLYTGLVAFIGEIIRNNVSGSTWQMECLTNKKIIWEPYIESSNIRYNPFFLVYKELYEEYPETGRVGFYDSVLIELAQR